MARATNIVATAKLDCDLKLVELAQKLPDTTYNPSKFLGLLLRTELSYLNHIANSTKMDVLRLMDVGL